MYIVSIPRLKSVVVKHYPQRLEVSVGKKAKILSELLAPN